MALENLQAATRIEAILNGDNITPATRREYFLKRAANEVPKPGGVSDAGKVPVVNSEGTGFNLATPAADLNGYGVEITEENGSYSVFAYDGFDTLADLYDAFVDSTRVKTLRLYGSEESGAGYAYTGTNAKFWKTSTLDGDVYHLTAYFFGARSTNAVEVLVLEMEYDDYSGTATDTVTKKTLTLS